VSDPAPDSHAEAQQRFCLPPPHAFSRFALPAIAAGLIALAVSSWLAMRALGDYGDTVIALGRAGDAPAGALPPAEALIDDERFASSVRRWPEREIALTRARAEALARAAQPQRAIEAYDRLAALLPLGLALGDALGRAEALAALARWDEALTALGGIDMVRADERERARAIALDARCRLARRR